MKATSRSLAAWFGLVVVLLLAGSLRADEAKPALPPGAPAGTRFEQDLKYADASPAQKLDLYLPPNSESSGPLPVIVYVHGGGWMGGDKKHFPALPLVARGYAVASVNYRFSQEAVFPAQIVDCKGAVRWLRAHAKEYHLDSDHFAAWGDSAGGHLVALLGTSGEVKEIEGDVGGNLDQSSRVQGVVDFFGPTDMSLFWDHAEPVENIFKAKRNESPITKLFGGAVETKKDLVRQANPVAFVSKDNPPFLIVHGDKDTLVPLAQSEILADALKKAGVEVQLEVLKGAGHGGAEFGKPSVRAAIVEFFDKHLKSPKK
jgi:acetyl esterase/lipase